MNYKDTIIKQLKFKLTLKNDGKNDLIIQIHAVMDAQANKSFFCGVGEAWEFMGEQQKAGVSITPEMLYAKLKEWGIDDVTLQAVSQRQKT